MAKKLKVILSDVHLHGACVSFYQIEGKTKTTVNFYKHGPFCKSDAELKIEALKLLQGGIKPFVFLFIDNTFSLSFPVNPLFSVYFEFKNANYKEIFEELSFSVYEHFQEKHNELLAGQ